MLKLHAKVGESVNLYAMHAGKEVKIEVKLCEVRGGRIIWGFKAPPGVKIFRAEIDPFMEKT